MEVAGRAMGGAERVTVGGARAREGEVAAEAACILRVRM